MERFDTAANAIRTGRTRWIRALARLGQKLSQPDRWTPLSSCDWYPDASSFPSTHYALIRTDERKP
jgi:hypothetical protein